MKLLILDGNSVINRAYYGVKPLTTRDGLYTHAIYGFLNILERMEKEEQPEAVCVAFDLHGPTFRHLKYEGYKATRHGMPQELAQQMPWMKDVLRAMNIPIYECQGWEADDIIGTVGRICGEQDWDCVVVTGDRDSLQLIDDHVTIALETTKGTIRFDEARFREEYGFEPKALVDLKALMGDSSDNIPGVKGIGEKTGKNLVQHFGSLEGVYAHLDDPIIKPKQRENLVQYRLDAELSYDLATIRPEAPIPFSPRDAIIRPYQAKELYDLFVRLEFVKLIDRYHLRGVEEDMEQSDTLEQTAKGLERVDHLPQMGEKAAMYLAPDGTMGLAWADGVCTLAPMEGHQVAPLLEQGSKWILHDCKTTWHRLAQMGWKAVDCGFDTALAAYDLNPSQSDYPISKLATNFLGRQVDDGDAAGCAETMWFLAEILEQELQQQGMTQLYETIELPLCDVLYRMEEEGIAIDEGALEQFGQMLSRRIEECESRIYDYAQERFNINSPKQLGGILFEKLGLPPVKKTKTGYSTNADVLEKLKNAHPIVPDIMDYRMLTKLKSTYADGLMKVIGEDGRIRTTFQNLVTATGRLSSTEPNLQNIPVRTDLGAEIRKMFVPREGCVLVDADYSQIELRVLSHIADDEVMQEAFRTGMDVHTVTASQVFGVPVEEVTPLQRRHAKAVNFGIVYGISEFSLSEDIGVSRWEARDYIDHYLTHYRGVGRYMKQVVVDAREKGYTQTIYGRRRAIPELTSSNFNIRSGAERIALNTPIQGSAADIIKLAMIRVDEALRKEYPQAKLILQVHDELIVECPQDIAPQVAELVSREMEQVATLRVPLTAEAKWGKSWYEAK